MRVNACWRHQALREALERGTKPNEVQWSFVPWRKGLSFTRLLFQAQGADDFMKSITLKPALACLWKWTIEVRALRSALPWDYARSGILHPRDSRRLFRSPRRRRP